MEQLNGLWLLLTSHGIPASVFLIVALGFLRWVLSRYLRRERRISKELRLRWHNFIKNGIVLAGLIGLVLIWAPQLRAFALSLTAVAVAIVIATKELILCVSGSLLRASSGTFAIGDLVEYGGYTGYVVDQSLLTTQLQEVDPDSGIPSGNQVVLPNSLFLTTAVKNHSHLRPYCVHSFTLYLDPNQAFAIDAILDSLEQVAQSITTRNLAEREFEALPKWKRQLLKTSAPKIRLTSTDGAKIGFVVSLICQDATCTDNQGEVARAFYRSLAQSESNRIAGAVKA